MDKAKEIRSGESLDWKNLEDYLRIQLPELEGEMTVAQFHGGHANLTYLIKFANRELVLRRPPFGKIAPGAHDMKREFRVLSKLYKYFKPAPKAYHLCEDESIVGSVFVVLERRTGIVVRSAVPACFSTCENAERRLSEALIRTQAELHSVDFIKAGLSGLGRPDGFVQRQLKGWAKRWNLSKTDDDENMRFVLKQLSKQLPEPQRVSIIHNDLKLDNCQFQADNPDEVTAVFDWDMCTLGDPLIDFGTTLSYFPDQRTVRFNNLPILIKGDFPSKALLIEKYANYTGLDLSKISWYQAFAYWKGAIIFQQLFKRYQEGDTRDKRMANFAPMMKQMASVAREVLET